MKPRQLNGWDRAVIRSRQYVEEQEKAFDQVQRRPFTAPESPNSANARTISFIDNHERLEEEESYESNPFFVRRTRRAGSPPRKIIDSSPSVTSMNTWQTTMSREVIAAAEYSSSYSAVSIHKAPMLRPRPSTAFSDAPPRQSFVPAHSRRSGGAAARLIKKKGFDEPEEKSEHQRKLEMVMSKHKKMYKLKQENRARESWLRANRRERADAERLRYARQVLWLKMFMVIKHTDGWWTTMKEREDDIRHAHAKLKAALLINRFIIRRKAVKMVTQKINLEKILSKVLWRLRLFLRCVRRKLARKQVICFFSDFGLRRMAFVVNKFRSNVLRLQHICVAYNACTKARMELLQLKWEDIERKICIQVNEERHAASLLFQGRLRDEATSGSIMLDVNKSKLPMLAYKVNRTTEQATGLQRDMKVTFDKVLNLQVEREAVMMLKPKGLRKMLDPKVANEKRDIVPEDIRTDLQREFISERRGLHVKKINTREDKTKKQKETVGIEDVQRILEFRKDSNEDDGDRALEWTTMMVVTGDAAMSYKAIAEKQIRKYLKQQEEEDKKRMDRIMQKYHLEDQDESGGLASGGEGAPRPATAGTAKRRTSKDTTTKTDTTASSNQKERLRTV